jgi:hypothetical protein
MKVVVVQFVRCRSLLVTFLLIGLTSSLAKAEGVTPIDLSTVTCHRFLEGFDAIHATDGLKKSDEAAVQAYLYAFGYAVGYFQGRRDAIGSNSGIDLRHGDLLFIRRYLLKECAARRDDLFASVIRRIGGSLDR